MASTGATAWGKHFRGKGNVETVIKKDSQIFDYKDPKKKLNISIKKGTKITYVDENVYVNPALISSNGSFYRVTFDNIQKPGSIGKVNLKPQAFKVKEIDYSLDSYIKVIVDSLEERTDLSGELKLYLIELIEYISKKTNNTTNLKKFFSKNLPINEINKDFGEVLGPIEIIANDLLSSKKIKINNSAKIFVPSRPNEPLMDYGIKNNGKIYTISAKSGETTNTVKASDILMLLKKNDKTNNKWSNTPQYKVLECIANGSTVSGPAYAAAYLSNKYKEEFSGITEKGASSLTKSTYDVGEFASFIVNAGLVKPTALELAYEIEKRVAKISKDKLDFTEIFKDAILGEVIYVKFEIDSLGIPKFKVMASSDFGVKKVSLRSKNARTRSADKLGVQP